MDECIQYGLTKLNYSNIRHNQKEVVLQYTQGSDVLFCSPTGSGKSLTFEIAPYVLSFLRRTELLQELCVSVTVIVVSPLVSLMKSQEKALHAKCLRAVYLCDSLDGNERDIYNGNCDVILGSPESFLGVHRKLISRLAELKKLGALFIDEAHCIRKFGKKCAVTKKPAFRPAYDHLGELRSLAGPNIPVVALTATATTSTQDIIKKSLCMKDCHCVIVSPNKLNIRYAVHLIPSDDVSDNFQWLVHLLRDKGTTTPRLLIFFRRVEHMSTVFKHVMFELGTAAYVNYNEHGSNDDRNRILDMIHMKTSDVVKDSICAAYQNENSHMRVVLCTTSFSMGLDVKGVDTVVHYGPANGIEDYIQETGRAGRNPDQKCHAILIKYKRSTGSRNLSQEMKEYVNIVLCRRAKLLSHFESGAPDMPVKRHDCCDKCADRCSCLCECGHENECVCQSRCSGIDGGVHEYLRKYATNSTSSSESSSDDGFSSDSDFEIYRKKPVLLSSDED